MHPQSYSYLKLSNNCHGVKVKVTSNVNNPVKYECLKLCSGTALHYFMYLQPLVMREQVIKGLSGEVFLI